MPLAPATSRVLPSSGPQDDTALAEETRKSVQAEETKANEKAKKAQAIADDAQKDLDEALPALDAALASLRNLNKNDVTEVGGQENPRLSLRPLPGVSLTLAATILSGVRGADSPQAPASVPPVSPPGRDRHRGSVQGACRAYRYGGSLRGSLGCP